MTEGKTEFSDLIRRIRGGDAEAAAVLVRHYEPQIRLKVRTWLRLRNANLRRTFDSMDICQSVLADFFVRTTTGQFDLNDPGQLLSLLAAMARNKLRDYVKHQQRLCRDVRRIQTIESQEITDDKEDSPSVRLANEELLEEFRSRLSEEERRLSDARSAGGDWAFIAAELGGTPEGRRKQLARAINRVAHELKLGDDPGVEA